jgi:hypothetical protein
MVRDVMAVPPTGTGVERELSKLRRIATWIRSQLSAETIAEIMLFKNFLARKGEELPRSEDADIGVANIGIAYEAVQDIDVPKNGGSFGGRKSRLDCLEISITFDFCYNSILLFRSIYSSSILSIV